MKHQKTTQFLDNTPNKLSKFKTKNWVKINDESRGTYDTGSQLRCKTSILGSSLCDYSDAYILAKGTITVANTATKGADRRDAAEKLIFKNCAPFTNCISRIKNTQVVDAYDIDVVMPIYNLIENSDNYSKSSEDL